jgi:phospholipase/carboxylesterase
MRAFRAGFDDIEHAKRDPDFEKVRGKEIFDSVVDSLEMVVTKKREALGKTLQIEAHAFFKCHIKVPAEYDSTKTYPLVVGLHGLGANPEGFLRLWERFDEPQFIFASPQAPYLYQTGGEPGYTWHLWGLGEKVKSMSADYVVRVVEDLRRAYAISDVYLLGFSQGCAQTYITGIEHHRLFKGLVCFGGWLDEEHLAEEVLSAGKGLRVFIAHVQDDPSVEFKSGINARGILEKHGYEVTFHEFEGGHRVPQEPLREAQRWMFSQ